MIRTILVFILVVVLYHAVKAVVRSALRTYHADDGGAKLPGAEMVQDPNCRTYIVKDRALARKVDGMTTYFCSEACAREYEARRRN